MANKKYHGLPLVQQRVNNEMTIASDLLQQHIQTLVDDNARWQTLIADNILWELAYAPSLRHPAQLSGREEAVRHATWFVGAVENFRFFDLKVYALADPQGAVAEVKGEGLIKSTGQVYRQDYVVFLRALDGKITFLRELLIRCALPKRWTHRFSASNPEDERGARAFAGPAASQIIFSTCP
ncbi:MAG TPA: nuclear transport factor 2 family protein [Bryobacteraceae bacterium]|jgi:hypothetical protein|nr:nuclear transport factor 2 family protein [Bryobacteraceae bacterium]